MVDHRCMSRTRASTFTCSTAVTRTAPTVREFEAHFLYRATGGPASSHGWTWRGTWNDTDGHRAPCRSTTLCIWRCRSTRWMSSRWRNGAHLLTSIRPPCFASVLPAWHMYTNHGDQLMACLQRGTRVAFQHIHVCPNRYDYVVRLEPPPRAARAAGNTAHSRVSRLQILPRCIALQQEMRRCIERAPHFDEVVSVWMQHQWTGDGYCAWPKLPAEPRS